MMPAITYQVQFKPIVEQDSKTGLFLAYYNEFPAASASAETKEQAEKDLVTLLKVMFADHKEDMLEWIMKELMAMHSKSTTSILNRSKETLCFEGV